jgi:hypothetical protein
MINSKMYLPGELNRYSDFGAAQIPHNTMAMETKRMAKNHLEIEFLPNENP